jgi:uncharacterized membrane protein required for colicin V production
MNIVDYILLALLLAMIIVGSKKGLLRELTALFTLIPAVIVSINFMDSFSVIVHEQLGGSPMVVTFVSFLILLALAYAAFKLIGIGLSRMIHLRQMGKKDQMGGAFVGFMRGWIIISFTFFLLFLLPMPARFYLSVQESFFGPTLIKTIPFVYDTSSPLHPRSGTFLTKVESALLLKNSRAAVDADKQAEVNLVLHQFDKFYSSALP